MKKLDKETQDLLAAAIEKGIQKGMEKAMGIYTEVWLTAEEVTKQFGMISEDFISRHGKLLPRKRLGWMDKNGIMHEGGPYGYARNEIQRMIQSGEIMCMQE